MEQIRSISIQLEIDTNKSTYSKHFTNLEDAIAYYNDVMEGIDNCHIPVTIGEKKPYTMKQETFESIKKLIAPKLEIKGCIKGTEIWQYYRRQARNEGKVIYSYAYVTTVFRVLMNEKRERSEAIKLTKQTWKIL